MHAMTKNNKLLFWIGLGLFVIPELLWSPVANIYYTFFQSGSHIIPLRENFITSGGYDIWYKVVVFLELSGLIIALLFSKRSLFNNTQQSVGVLIYFLLCFLALAVILSFYAITFLNISFP